MAERGVDAFTSFFFSYAPRVRAFALRRTSDRAAADEIVARVMEIAWRRFDDIPAGAEFPWLCGVAVRVRSTLARSDRRFAAALDRLASEVATRRSHATVEADVMLHEQVDALFHAFRQLCAEDREILRLAAWEGLERQRARRRAGL